MRSTTRLAAAGILAAAALALTACSSGAGSSTSDSSSSDGVVDAVGLASAMDPAADLVGPGCAAYAKQVPSGSGSVAGHGAGPGRDRGEQQPAADHPGRRRLRQAQREA